MGKEVLFLFDKCLMEKQQQLCAIPSPFAFMIYTEVSFNLIIMKICSYATIN
jgi:hypothetical protein